MSPFPTGIPFANFPFSPSSSQDLKGFWQPVGSAGAVPGGSRRGVEEEGTERQGEALAFAKRLRSVGDAKRYGHCCRASLALMLTGLTGPCPVGELEEHDFDEGISEMESWKPQPSSPLCFAAGRGAVSGIAKLPANGLSLCQGPKHMEEQANAIQQQRQRKLKTRGMQSGSSGSGVWDSVMV